MRTDNQSARLSAQGRVPRWVTIYQQRIQTSQVDQDADAAEQPKPTVFISPGGGKTILIVDPHVRMLLSMMQQARRPEAP